MLPDGRLVDGIAVVGAVRGHSCDAALDLSKQAWRLGRVIRIAGRESVCGDLASRGIHGKMELASLPTGAPMFLRVPLALAK